MFISENLTDEQCRKIAEWVLLETLYGREIWSVSNGGKLENKSSFDFLEGHEKAAKDFQKNCPDYKELIALMEQKTSSVREFLDSQFGEIVDGDE